MIRKPTLFEVVVLQLWSWRVRYFIGLHEARIRKRDLWFRHQMELLDWERCIKKQKRDGVPPMPRPHGFRLRYRSTIQTVLLWKRELEKRNRKGETMSGVEKSKIDYRRNRLETLRDNVHRNMVKMREIKKQYPELRMGFMFEVGSLLNAYRDGDLTFEEAKANIEIAVKEKLEWEKQKSLIRQRDKATVAEMFTALRDAGVSMSGKLHRVVPMNEIPEGEYPGKWSGYSVQFQTPVGLMICDSGVGVRGIDVPCVVIVSAGGIQCLKV